MASEFLYTRMVQFAETDAAGVMHFANFFHFMEEAEHAFWRSLGLSVHATPVPGEQHPVSWPRVAVSCEYGAPARFEETIDVAVRLAHLGGKSIEFSFEFRRGEAKLATGKIKAVCCEVGRGTFRAVDIPSHIRTKLEAARPASGR
jgi:YbgC/YbaW family acyl-CoA thioester hydrolase